MVELQTLQCWHVLCQQLTKACKLAATAQNWCIVLLVDSKKRLATQLPATERLLKARMRSQKAAIFTFRFEGRLYSCTAHLMSLMKFKQITRGKDLLLMCPQEIGQKSVRVLMSFPIYEWTDRFTSPNFWWK